MNLSRRCLLGSVATLALAMTPASPSLAQPLNKPNIVVMLMDNLGYGELGIYGGGILRGGVLRYEERNGAGKPRRHTHK